MEKIKKTICAFMCVLILMPCINVQAKKSKDYWPKPSEKITASAAILMDVDTGTILYKKNIDKKYYPASITKILTTLIAVENSSMDEIVTFSKDAIYKTEGSGIWRDVGEKMTMEQCLYAVMLESANECAYAVAEHIGGSMENFVKMMNEKAKKLGCTSSHFSNPHGLPDENHYVTAMDMAIISRAAYANETFRLICGTKRYTIPVTNKHDEETYMVNHHKMLYPKDTDIYLYDYCTGGKTGYTMAAGYTLVTYAQKDGMTLLAVLLNGSSPVYWNETRALFDFGFENFNMCVVSENMEIGDYEKEKYDSLNTNEPYAEIDPQAKIVLPKTVDFTKASMKIISSDLPDGALAQLKYTYGKRDIGTANIIRTNTKIDWNEVEMQDNADKATKDTSAKLIEKQENTDSIDNTSTDNVNDGNGDQREIDDKEKFDIKNYFFAIIDNIKKFEIDSSNIKWIIAAGIILGILLVLIILKLVFNNSYVIRQRFANYKNQKKASKQYVIIQDTTNRKRRRRRRRKNR